MRMIHVIYDSLDFLLILLVYIVFFSYLAFILFHDLVPLDSSESYFGFFTTSMLNMYILLTTSNFPDAALPYYAYTRASIFFFILYLLIGIFLLLSLLLAVFYNNYT
mmetsp:Transcript_24351/g.18524  ORF Transcript_24351/g.18524 Transcript_24351/m.18524 type:complete len:107 (-) Transcript_24351:321-641(-)